MPTTTTLYTWRCLNRSTGKVVRDSANLPTGDAIQYDTPLRSSYSSPKEAMEAAKRHVVLLGLFGRYDLNVYNASQEPVLSAGYLWGKFEN